MEVLCFFILVGKLIYDACKTAYANWYAKNRNPYRTYRQNMAKNKKEKKEK